MVECPADPRGARTAGASRQPPWRRAPAGARSACSRLPRSAASIGVCGVGDTWGCGRISQTPADGVHRAPRLLSRCERVFADLYRPTEDLSIDFHPESTYFVQSITYRSEVAPWFERRPLRARVIRALQPDAPSGCARLQAGSLHLYLLYVTTRVIARLLLVFR